MYAIFEACGKQYKVTDGEVLFIEKIEKEAGEDVVFDKVLCVGDDNGTVFGAAVMPESYQPMGIMLNVPGGFVTLGLLLILVNAIKKLAAKKSAARKEGLA